MVLFKVWTFREHFLKYCRDHQAIIIMESLEKLPGPDTLCCLMSWIFLEIPTSESGSVEKYHEVCGGIAIGAGDAERQLK